MPRSARRSSGFTLIELMVTVAVIILLSALAYPSFIAVRQRAAVRGAAEQTVGFWNQARLEAAKRNSFVKVGYGTSGNNFCLGATTTTDPTNHTACDCFESDSTQTATFCNVSRFPANASNQAADILASQSEWRGVTLATSSFGTTNVAVIEPKRTSVVDATDIGNITLNSPSGRKNYRLNVHVDQFGRAVVCQSNASGIDDMPDFNNRKCAD